MTIKSKKILIGHLHHKKKKFNHGAKTNTVSVFFVCLFLLELPKRTRGLDILQTIYVQLGAGVNVSWYQHL